MKKLSEKWLWKELEKVERMKGELCDLLTDKNLLSEIKIGSTYEIEKEVDILGFIKISEWDKVEVLEIEEWDNSCTTKIKFKVLSTWEEHNVSFWVFVANICQDLVKKSNENARRAKELRKEIEHEEAKLEKAHWKTNEVEETIEWVRAEVHDMWLVARLISKAFKPEKKK